MARMSPLSVLTQVSLTWGTFRRTVALSLRSSRSPTQGVPSSTFTVQVRIAPASRLPCRKNQSHQARKAHSRLRSMPPQSPAVFLPLGFISTRTLRQIVIGCVCMPLRLMCHEGVETVLICASWGGDCFPNHCFSMIWQRLLALNWGITSLYILLFGKNVLFSQW